MLEHEYNIILDRSVVEPVHCIEVVGGFNATYKSFLSMLMTTVQLPGAAYYNSHMALHTSTANIDIIIHMENK